MAEKSDPYGGYEHEFVHKVPERFICQICTKALRDPHLAVCCGQHFCESCLNRWFTRQRKESCPHCRSEGEAFNHVIHKGLRSEINQLKIRCSNHGEGCQWIGELGALKKHLESDNGCGYVIVNCPNQCRTVLRQNFNRIVTDTTMKRKDLEKHLICDCYLRPYQCEFCGHKDTYKEITGQGSLKVIFATKPYGGHQAKCPEAPLTCPNNCGANKIKRKDMESHRSQCPQEPVECPFAEAGCKEQLTHRQLEAHVTSYQQQHLLLVMKDYKETKRELSEVKGTLITAVKLLKQGREADKETIDYVIAYLSRLMKKNDSVEVIMPKFSEYHRSGKEWHSPPFYYREGYKMCLAVHVNGVGKGAGTHVSVTLVLLKGEHNIEHQLVRKCHDVHIRLRLPQGHGWFNVCQWQPLSQYSEVEKELSSKETFCSQEYITSKLVNDCLTFNIIYSDECDLKVSVK